MKVIRIVGVLEDGSVPPDGVPIHTDTWLQFSKGARVLVELDVVHPSGAVPDMTDATITLKAKKRSQDEDTIFTLTGAHNASRGLGSVDFTITAAATAGLEPGRYCFDVWADFGSGDRSPLVALSPLLLLPAAG